jgi:hypothetical protein
MKVYSRVTRNTELFLFHLISHCLLYAEKFQKLPVLLSGSGFINNLCNVKMVIFSNDQFVRFLSIR